MVPQRLGYSSISGRLQSVSRDRLSASICLRRPRTGWQQGIRRHDGFATLEEVPGDVRGAALSEGGETREVVHQRVRAKSADSVAPERDVPPSPAPGTVGQHLDLAMLIENERAMQIA